jgi:hypothetical protein
MPLTADYRHVPNCSGGLIQHIDGTIAGCALDDVAEQRERP